jgi:hypothetical protein
MEWISDLASDEVPAGCANVQIGVVGGTEAGVANAGGSNDAFGGWNGGASDGLRFTELRLGETDVVEKKQRKAKSLYSGSP